MAQLKVRRLLGLVIQTMFEYTSFEQIIEEYTNNTEPEYTEYIGDFLKEEGIYRWLNFNPNQGLLFDDLKKDIEARFDELTKNLKKKDC